MLLLRPVVDSDVEVFFAHQADPASAELAGVPSRDREAHDAHWARIRADPGFVIRAVVVDGAVAGQVLAFPRDGVCELGYWFGREFWGRGIAGEAVAAFLPLVTERPLHAVVAPHNAASRRVLERLGFVASGRKGDAVVLRLDAPGPA
jgi:RimJ/RimL family protein N-acetyltransferase